MSKESKRTKERGEGGTQREQGVERESRKKWEEGERQIPIKKRVEEEQLTGSRARDSGQAEKRRLEDEEGNRNSSEEREKVRVDLNFKR